MFWVSSVANGEITIPLKTFVVLGDVPFSRIFAEAARRMDFERLGLNRKSGKIPQRSVDKKENYKFGMVSGL